MTRHYFHESEAALNSAVAALPSVTGGEPVGGAGGGMSARLRSVCALADELTAEERAELLRHLQGAADNAANPSAVECVPMLENKSAQEKPSAGAAAA